MAIDDVFTLHVNLLDPTSQLTAQINPSFRQETESLSAELGKDLVDNFVATCESAFLACIAEPYQLQDYAVVQRPEGVIVYEAPGDLNNGHGVTDCMPRDVSGLISIRTAEISKRGRGRLYVGPVDEAWNGAGGNPNLTFIGLLNAFGLSLMDMAAGDVSYAGFTWGLWSGKDAAFRPLTSFIARSYWGSQRGRRR